MVERSGASKGRMNSGGFRAIRGSQCSSVGSYGPWRIEEKVNDHDQRGRSD